jgi:hypothetical protein
LCASPSSVSVSRASFNFCLLRCAPFLATIIRTEILDLSNMVVMLFYIPSYQIPWSLLCHWIFWIFGLIVKQENDVNDSFPISLSVELQLNTIYVCPDLGL